jgi:hypothetical protein
MTGDHSNRLVKPITRILNMDSMRQRTPGSPRPAFSACRALCIIALLGAAPPSHAQQWPATSGSPYAQAYAQSAASPYGYYGYPQGYQQPLQRAQNVYYGNYQDNRVPGYIYPRPNNVPNNYGYNSGGITYYYVENPHGPNYYPFASPYGAPPANSRVPSRGTSWPAPANAAPPKPSSNPLDGDPPPDEGRKPTVSFHRTPDECFWFKAGYIGALIPPMRLGGGPLLTTGTSGILFQPSTSVLFGDRNVDFNLFSGIRLEGGLFLDRENRFSLDLSGFLLFPNTESFYIASDNKGNPRILRPIFNVDTNKEGGFLRSQPGSIAGLVAIDNRSDMGGIELNARYHSYIGERLHADVLFGFRYLRLGEQLRIQDQITPLRNNFLTFQGTFVNAPNSLADDDSFHTVNQFFGPQIGGRLAWEYGPFTPEGFVKLALGGSEERTTINGSTTKITPAGNQTVPGGILAVPSNMGNHSRTVMGIVPELGLNLGVELTQHVRLNLGYSLLLWNHVVRPGSQYDRSVNPNQVPGSPTFGAASNAPFSPTYRFNDEFFWTHTFNIGVDIHY